MSHKPKRKSISDAFPDISLPSRMERLNLESTHNKDNIPQHRSMIRQLSLGKASAVWPTWSTVGRGSGQPSVMFTIRIEPGVLDYTKYGPSTAENVFNEAANHIYDLRSTTEHDPQTIDTTDDELIEQMSMMVFGSNMIERVGSNLAETIQLCQKVFRDEKLPNIPPRSLEYRQRLEAYIQANTTSERQIRERREIVNHAMAFMHMVNCIIRDDQPFSEDNIKQTHAILCSDIPVETIEKEIIQSNKYIGQYRTRHVHASSTNFVTPNKIGQAMSRFVQELNGHLMQAEKEQIIDPFFIAAHACGEFVNIHPFLDGNGRTCRIILNTILLKYAGIVCPIGEHDHERAEYMDIVKRRSNEECGNGELSWYTLKRSMPIFRRIRDKIKSR